MNFRHYIYHVALKCWPSTPIVAHKYVYMYIYIIMYFKEVKKRGWIGLSSSSAKTLCPSLHVGLQFQTCCIGRKIKHMKSNKTYEICCLPFGENPHVFTFPFQSRHKTKQLNFTRQNSLYLGKQKHIFVPQPSNQTIPSPKKNILSNFTHPLFSQRCSSWWLNPPISKI